MSVTDGNITRTYGEIHVAKKDVKRAYERLRKRSWRRASSRGFFSTKWSEGTTNVAHHAYVRGLRDMAEALTASNGDGI